MQRMRSGVHLRGRWYFGAVSAMARPSGIAWKHAGVKPTADTHQSVPQWVLMTSSTVRLLISARNSRLLGAPWAFAHSSDQGSLYQIGMVR